MSRVAVAIFIHKSEPDWFERISLQQCGRILGNYPLFLVAPQGLDVSVYLEIEPRLQIRPMPKKWFVDLKAYNRMKLCPSLYRQFEGFEYLLTYELDSFVFRDDLEFWCKQGWDYIGAPWFEGIYQVTEDSKFKGVGNSGFSLRNIQSCLRVVNDYRFILPLQDVWHDPRRKKQPWVKSFVGKILNSSTRNRFHWAANSYKGNEDFFWGLEADKRFEWWKTADFDAASHFSFEANAPMLYQETAQLPFGCHKWDSVHKDFWRSHLEACGFELPESYGR
jgi:hypothetical protein